MKHKIMLPLEIQPQVRYNIFQSLTVKGDEELRDSSLDRQPLPSQLME